MVELIKNEAPSEEQKKAGINSAQFVKTALDGKPFQIHLDDKDKIIAIEEMDPANPGKAGKYGKVEAGATFDTKNPDSEENKKAVLSAVAGKKPGEEPDFFSRNKGLLGGGVIGLIIGLIGMMMGLGPLGLIAGLGLGGLIGSQMDDPSKDQKQGGSQGQNAVQKKNPPAKELLSKEHMKSIEDARRQAGKQQETGGVQGGVDTNHITPGNAHTAAPATPGKGK